MLAAVLFFSALAPVRSEAEPGECAGLHVTLIPADPLPGETVQVRVMAVPSSRLALPGGACWHKRVRVDGGSLTALVREGAAPALLEVSGAQLSGDLSCIDWTLPAGPGQHELEVRVGGHRAAAAVDTTPATQLEHAAAREWLRPAVNLCRSLGVR